MKITVTLPTIITARDYHEFPDMEDMLNSIMDENDVSPIKVEEIGLNSDGLYMAVAYSGELPGEEAIVSLMDEFDMYFDDESYE